MNYYQEITLIDSKGIRFFELWSKFYTQLHLALVEQAKLSKGEDATHGDIGISFPEYHSVNKGDEEIHILGSKLRVFAKTDAELRQLDLNKWCERLLDYVHIKSIAEVKNIKEYVQVKRFRQIKNNDRLTRAYAKKHQLSFEQAKNERIKRFADKHNVSIEESAKHYDNPTLKNRPYIQIESLQSKHGFSLELEQTKVDNSVEGVFNTYGLSSFKFGDQLATVPHW